MTDTTSDRLTQDEVDQGHAMAMQAIGFMGSLLSGHRASFDALLKAERHFQSAGIVIDPTLYRQMLHSESFKLQIRLVKAAVAFIDEIDAVKAEIEAQSAGKVKNAQASD